MLMPLGKKKITSSRLILGCMGFGGEWNSNQITKDDIMTAEHAIDAALINNITMFDHADIYKSGRAEQVFGQVLKGKKGLRDKIIIQSKCGIRFAEGDIPNRYDFSKHHIIQSVDGILGRLGIDYLDILLLHRPDPLMEPEEVAEAFSLLKKSGKVRNFGVSNMNVPQIQLLQAYCEEPIIVNQLEMSLNRIDWLEQGVLVNQKAGTSINFGEGLVEYCRLHEIQIQAWSPLARGMYTGRKVENMTESEYKTYQLVDALAKKKNTTQEAIVLGWLMRHPAAIQPVIGTTDPQRIKNCAEAIQQAEMMSREEWYSLYVTSRGSLMP